MLCQLVGEEGIYCDALQGVLCGRKLFYDADAVDNYIGIYSVDCGANSLEIICMMVPRIFIFEKTGSTCKDGCIPAHRSGNRMFPREHLHQFMAKHSGGAEYQNSHLKTRFGCLFVNSFTYYR